MFELEKEGKDSNWLITSIATCLIEIIHLIDWSECKLWFLKSLIVYSIKIDRWGNVLSWFKISVWGHFSFKTLSAILMSLLSFKHLRRPATYYPFVIEHEVEYHRFQKPNLKRRLSICHSQPSFNHYRSKSRRG